MTDPIGPRSGVNRVRRGGGWHNSAYDSRVAECGYSYPSSFNGYGFRVALSEFPPDESDKPIDPCRLFDRSSLGSRSLPFRGKSLAHDPCRTDLALCGLKPRVGSG